MHVSRTAPRAGRAASPQRGAGGGGQPSSTGTPTSEPYSVQLPS